MVELRPKPDGTRISIEAGTHICAMYFGVRERNEILLPFLSEGLRRGDKCFAAVQEPDSADLIAKLANQTGSEVDLTISIDREQLEVRTSAEQLLSPDHFDPSVIIEFWDGRVTSALAKGFGFVRLTAEARWWLPQLPGIEDLIRYESELNRFTLKHPQAILCMYDLSLYSESIVVELLKTHPLVLLSGLPIENPYYLTPDEFLAERSQRS